MTIGVDSGLQPVAQLPEDILHLIVSAYVTARSEEDALNWNRRQVHKEKAAWPILPLLLTCKLLRDLTIPQLYRDIKLPRSHTLKKFINAPAVESYQYMHRLEVFRSKTMDAWDLDPRLTHCFFRYMLKLPAGNNASDMDLSAFKELRSKWVRSCRPRLEVLKLQGQARRAVEGLLALFDIRHVQYAGFGIRDADDQVTLPLNLCETTELFCHPGMDYNTRYEWIIESTLTSLGVQDCHWSMDRPEDASPATVIIRYGSYGYKQYGNLPLADLGTPSMLKSCPPACNLPTLIRAIAEASSRPINFVITPQIDRSDHHHRFCFPKLRPIDQQGGDLAVKFESACNCGHGDANHFWDGITEALADMIEQLDKSHEESDDEEDSEGDGDGSEEDDEGSNQ